MRTQLLDEVEAGHVVAAEGGVGHALHDASHDLVAGVVLAAVDEEGGLVGRTGAVLQGNLALHLRVVVVVHHEDSERRRCNTA